MSRSSETAALFVAKRDHLVAESHNDDSSSGICVWVLTFEPCGDGSHLRLRLFQTHATLHARGRAKILARAAHALAASGSGSGTQISVPSGKVKFRPGGAAVGLPPPLFDHQEPLPVGGQHLTFVG
jgi:hypothetical protein